MSSMDQNYAMYEGQQQKPQVVVEGSVPTSLAERSHLYPHLNQLPPIMSSSVYDFRLQTSSTDPANNTGVEEVEATAIKSLRYDEEIKNRIKQIIGESRATLEGAQHNALQQAQNALQQAQHPSTTFQHLQAQLQKQQQQLQRTGTDVTVPGSISGALPMPLPPSVAAARAAGDVIYPALPQSSMLASTQDAIAERRAAVAAVVASVPERAAAAAAAAVAAAKKSGLTTELQNMGLVKPGSPPPADSRSPPPTLASLAALHVEPPPPYVSNPSLAAYRSLLPQQPYSAHLANLMSGLSSTMGNSAFQGVPGLSGLAGLPSLQGLSGLPGLSGPLSGVTNSAAHTIPSLSLPSQLSAGLAHLAQPTQPTQPTNLQLPPMPPLPSALASSALPSLSMPSSLPIPQPCAAPAWQSTTTSDRENTAYHSGACHSQPMAMIPMPFAMSIPMHICPSPWMSSQPVIWVGNPACCSSTGAACPSAGNCCQTASGQTPSAGMPTFPLGYPTQRSSFAMPNVHSGLAQTGPPGYRIPATLNTRSAATSTLNVQQPLPEKPKVFQ